jgi:hypothetical protein
MAWGCGGGDDRAAPEDTGLEMRTGPFSIAPLVPQAEANTPRALSMSLSGTANDIYRVAAKSYIERGYDRVALTPCLEADLWRVGPRRVSWPSDRTFELPLDYATTLPDGVYAEQLALSTLSYGGGVHLRSRGFQTSSRPFEVIGGALRPMDQWDYSQYQDRLFPRNGQGELIAGGYSFNSPPVGFCASPPLTDQASPEEALSIVDLDAWQDAASLQPLRLDPVAQTLSYQTVSEALALSLQFVLAMPPDVAFGEAHVQLGGRSVLIVEPSPPWTRDDISVSRSGSAVVRSLGDGRLAVEFSDVVLENSLAPPLQRRLPTGSIVGVWTESP